LTLVKGQITTVSPIVNYKTNLVFELKEDFENVGIALIPEIISDTPIVFIEKSMYPEIVKYGNKCGAVFLTTMDSLFKASTQSDYDLPKGEEVYLEIDFMNSNSMVTGVIAKTSSSYIEHTPYVIMPAQDPATMVWKKIYIELTEDVSWETLATSYEFYLLSILDSDKTSGVIYLDNIKLIHYQ